MKNLETDRFLSTFFIESVQNWMGVSDWIWDEEGRHSSFLRRVQDFELINNSWLKSDTRMYEYIILLRNRTIISKLDCNKSYWQVNIANLKKIAKIYRMNVVSRSILFHEHAIWTKSPCRRWNTPWTTYLHILMEKVTCLFKRYFNLFENHRRTHEPCLASTYAIKQYGRDGAFEEKRLFQKLHELSGKR